MKHTVETKEKIRSLEFFLPFLFIYYFFIIPPPLQFHCFGMRLAGGSAVPSTALC